MPTSRDEALPPWPGAYMVPTQVICNSWMPGAEVLTTVSWSASPHITAEAEIGGVVEGISMAKFKVVR